jgi:hypothetical protein
MGLSGVSLAGSDTLCSTTNSTMQNAVQPVYVVIRSLHNKNGAICDQDHQCHVCCTYGSGQEKSASNNHHR